MKREEIFEKVKDIMEDKLGVDPEEVGETTKVVDDLGADSLDTVELIMEFEKEFGITIPDEEVEKVTTVGEIVDGIQELMKK